MPFLLTLSAISRQRVFEADGDVEIPTVARGGGGGGPGPWYVAVWNHGDARME
jgi:hypothetical protein